MTHFDVVAPKGLDFIKTLDFSYTYPAGTAGAGMLAQIVPTPTDVSFHRIEIREVSGPASNVYGYFANPVFNTYHTAEVTWALAYIPNSPEPYRFDQIFIGGFDQAGQRQIRPLYNGTNGDPPWSDGGFDVLIPNRYRILGSANMEGHPFNSATQLYRIKATGELTLSKSAGGISATTSRLP